MSEVTSSRAGVDQEQAFRRLIEPYRRELQVHCYLMLGSVQDAEDMVQETLVAAWRGLAGFEGRASLRAWLYRIATNRCLNARRAARRRPPAAPVPPFEPPEPTRRGEVTWLQPYPDSLMEEVSGGEPGPEARYEAREAIELGFVAALQRLPRRQVAAVVLHDVLGFRTVEVAGMLGSTETAVKASLQRARSSLSQRRPAPPRQLRLSAGELALARRFADAFHADDIDGVVGMLTEGAWLAMPPAPHEYHGRAAIASFLRASAAWRAGRRFLLIPTRSNGQPAFGCYLGALEGAAAQAAGVIVLTLDGDQICTITRFLDNGILRYFGLPPTLSEHESAQTQL